LLFYFRLGAELFVISSSYGVCFDFSSLYGVCLVRFKFSADSMISESSTLQIRMHDYSGHLNFVISMVGFVIFVDIRPFHAIFLIISLIFYVSLVSIFSIIFLIQLMKDNLVKLLVISLFCTIIITFLNLCNMIKMTYILKQMKYLKRIQFHSPILYSNT
jgi:hypothetical protein